MAATPNDPFFIRTKGLTDDQDAEDLAGLILDALGIEDAPRLQRCPPEWRWPVMLCCCRPD
jgi:hypothetical protein